MIRNSLPWAILIQLINLGDIESIVAFQANVRFFPRSRSLSPITSPHRPALVPNFQHGSNNDLRNLTFSSMEKPSSECMKRKHISIGHSIVRVVSFIGGVEMKPDVSPGRSRME